MSCARCQKSCCGRHAVLLEANQKAPIRDTAHAFVYLLRRRSHLSPQDAQSLVQCALLSYLSSCDVWCWNSAVWRRVSSCGLEGPQDNQCLFASTAGEIDMLTQTTACESGCRLNLTPLCLASILTPDSAATCLEDRCRTATICRVVLLGQCDPSKL